MSHRKIKGIVFDLDATLVNIGEYVEWKTAHEKIVEKYIEQGCDEAEVQACSAKGLFTMLDEMWINLNEQDKNSAKEIQDTAYKILSEHEEVGAKSCILMTGCVETLQWIKKIKLPMGICTSNSLKAAKAALKRQNLEQYFDVVIGRSSKYRMKPHPEQLEACFKELGVDPKQGMMIGDSHKDILAGKALGAYTVAIPVYFSRIERIKEAKADAILNDLTELPDLISSIIGE